jgi:hypothetical protein
MLRVGVCFPGEGKKGSTSFLKKRSKKLLPIAATARRRKGGQIRTPRAKVFWFFFSKKGTAFSLLRVSGLRLRR